MRTQTHPGLRTNGPRTISAAQCRAARAFLDWSHKRLSVRSNVRAVLLRDFERGKVTLPEGVGETLIAAFETAGLRFLAEGDVVPEGDGFCATFAVPAG